MWPDGGNLIIGPLQETSLTVNQWPLLAESGSQNLVFPAFLGPALPPLAAIRVIGWCGAADDP